MGRPPKFPSLDEIILPHVNDDARVNPADINQGLDVCRSNPGVWHVLAVYPTRERAKNAASNIRRPERRQRLGEGEWFFTHSHKDHPRHGRQWVLLGGVVYE